MSSPGSSPRSITVQWPTNVVLGKPVNPNTFTVQHNSFNHVLIMFNGEVSHLMFCEKMLYIFLHDVVLLDSHTSMSIRNKSRNIYGKNPTQNKNNIKWKKNNNNDKRSKNKYKKAYSKQTPNKFKLQSVAAPVVWPFTFLLIHGRKLLMTTKSPCCFRYDCIIIRLPCSLLAFPKRCNITIANVTCCSRFHDSQMCFIQTSKVKGLFETCKNIVIYVTCLCFKY